MDNAFCVLVNGMLFCMTVCLLFYIVRQFRVSALNRRYVLFFVSLLAWSAAEIARFLVEDENLLRYVYELRLSATGLAFATFFIVVTASFYPKGKLPGWLPAATLAIPAATAVIAAVPYNSALLMSDFSVTSLSPLTRADIRYGFWVYVLIGYMAVLTLAIFAALTMRYRSRPAAYRSDSLLFALCFVLLALGAAIMLLFPGSFCGHVFAAVGGLALYITFELRGQAGVLQIERDDMFNYLESAVLLLSPDERILDMNSSARALMDILGENAEGRQIDEFFSDLFANGKLLRKSPDTQNTHLYLANANYPLIYHVLRQEVPRSGKKNAWAFVCLEDITRNQLFIERLQNMAGIDSLTGLYNRFGYMSLLRSLDTPENLPISVIVGDVDGLKKINDTYGHPTGDRFLSAISTAIKSCCNENCYAARIGGDEFVLLAKNCDEIGGKKLMDELHHAVAAIEGLEQKPSVALGCATKIHADENINTLLNHADKLMYSDKR